jgi:hypothetical protein
MTPFAELTGRQKVIEVLRWLAVVPAAVLSVAALRIIARFVMPPLVIQPPGTPVIPVSEGRLLLVRALYILMGLAFVIAGASMAPRWHFATAVVLSLVWIGYSFLYQVLVHLGQGPPHYVYFALESVSAACGAVAIYFIERIARRNALRIPA